MTVLAGGAPIRVGIVGLSASGGWARKAHVPALAALGTYQLEGVLASGPAASRRAAEAFDIPRSFGSVQEMSRCEAIDLAVVTVKVPHHVEILEPLIRGGRHVLCEWPLAPTTREAEQLATLATKGGVHVAIGLQGRAAPAFRYLRDLVSGGAIGEVLSTSLIGAGPSWGPTTDSRSSYLRDVESGATMLSISVGHTIDVVSMCLGDIVELQAATAVRRPMVRDTGTGQKRSATSPDQVAVTATLRGGATATIHYRGGRSAGTGLHWEINGTAGDIIVRGRTGHLQHGDVEIHGALDGEVSMRPLPIPRGYDYVPGLAELRDGPHAVGNAYHRLYDDLASGSSKVPTFTDALRLHGLLETIEAAAATGVRQRVV